MITQVPIIRDHFVYAPSQWETTLQCNVVSHWLEAFIKWSMQNIQNTARITPGISHAKWRPFCSGGDELNVSLQRLSINYFGWDENFILPFLKTSYSWTVNVGYGYLLRQVLIFRIVVNITPYSTPIYREFVGIYTLKHRSFDWRIHVHLDTSIANGRSLCPGFNGSFFRYRGRL